MFKRQRQNKKIPVHAKWAYSEEDEPSRPSGYTTVSVCYRRDGVICLFLHRAPYRCRWMRGVCASRFVFFFCPPPSKLLHGSTSYVCFKVYSGNLKNDTIRALGDIWISNGIDVSFPPVINYDNIPRGVSVCILCSYSKVSLYGRVGDAPRCRT